MKEPKTYNVIHTAKRTIKVTSLRMGNKTAYRLGTIVKKLPTRKILQ